VRVGYIKRRKKIIGKNPSQRNDSFRKVRSMGDIVVIRNDFVWGATMDIISIAMMEKISASSSTPSCAKKRYGADRR